MAPRISISAKLLGATLLPTVATFAVVGFASHRVARRALEEELGRRLTTVAQAAALAVRADRVDLLAPGDDESRASRNAQRKLLELRDAAQVKRIYLFDAAHASRGDTDATPIGARYYELDADDSELARVFGGAPASSILFAGKDGALYKSGFAPLPSDQGGAPSVAVGVDGSAALYEQLAGFRRALFLVGGLGIGVMGALSVALGRVLTRPVRRLEEAARRIGQGDLAAPVVSTSNDEIGLFAATLDAMREQLRARDQRLQMMLAGIAHEVRNPLGGMALFVGLLREELAGDLEKLSHVARIERELGRLGSVVSDFLDYARRPRPELRPTDAAALIREAHEVLCGDGEQAGVTFTVAAPAMAMVAADAGQLRRALLNLGRNALLASPRGARVTLACTVENRHVRLAVRDTGCGIPSDKFGAIFTPFYTTREQGTGLGLAFVAEIARDHGGEVKVESTVGAGSEFSLHLPLLEPPV